jgi:hypothetical protein
MMTEETRKTLGRLIAMTDRLANRSFVKYAMKNRVGFTIKSGARVRHKAPREESVDAALMIVRMLVYPSDPISIRHLPALAEKDPGLSAEWRGWIAHALSQLADFLARPTRINFEGHEFTNHELFNTINYGDRVHTTQVERFERWKALQAPRFEILRGFFHFVVMDVIRIIFLVEEVTKKELAGEPLPAPPTPTAAQSAGAP